MKGRSFASSFRKPIFFTLVLILFTIMIGSGMRRPFGTRIPAATVTATTIETARPSSAGVAASPLSKHPVPAATPFAAMVTVTKTDNISTLANPGDTIMYSIEITNTGDANATNVNFTDMIDANTTLVPGSVASNPVATNESYPNGLGNTRLVT